METPRGTPAISEHTQIKAPLWRTIAIAGSVLATVAGATATISVQYARLSDRVDRHIGDTDIHLNTKENSAHGRPVGSFDFSIALARIETKLEKIENRNEFACTTSRGIMTCTQKEAK